MYSLYSLSFLLDECKQKFPKPSLNLLPANSVAECPKAGKTNTNTTFAVDF